MGISQTEPVTSTRRPRGHRYITRHAGVGSRAEQTEVEIPPVAAAGSGDHQPSEQRWASLPKFGNRYRYLPQPELLKAQSQLRNYFADLRTATRNSATPQLRYPHLLDTYV